MDAIPAAKKYKVAIFVWSTRGGAFSVIAANLAKGLLAQGCEVDVLHLRGQATESREAFDKRVGLRELKSSRSMFSAPFLARYLRQEQPTLLISLGWLQNAASVVAKTLSRWRGLLILSEHANMSLEAGFEHGSSFRLRQMPLVARFLYPRADGLVAVSADVSRDLTENIGLTPSRPPIRVIPNPVDAARIRDLTGETAGHLWADEKEQPLILSVGRLAKQKNHALLLDAIARIRQSVDFRLLILGEGPLRKELQTKVNQLGLAERVQLPGYVSNPFAFMSKADVFALSSREEGFGLVLVEAMAAGCPVVATDCPGGPSDVLKQGDAGVLVPPQDAEALATALKAVLTERPLRERLIAAGRIRAGDYDSIEIARQWLQFARDVGNVKSSSSSFQT